VKRAEEHSLTSISFPAISTGAYEYPVSQAAPIAISATIEALTAARHVIKCRFVLFDVSTVRAFERAAEKLSKTNSSFHIEKASA
jgi:O-acetyl-ADP-ribose deacetylase